MAYLKTFAILLYFFIAMPSARAQDNEILIVSDKDGLEWNVANYLEQYFSDNDFNVNNILISEFTKKKSIKYKVVIMFSVIQNNKIPANIRSKIPLREDKNRNKKETIFFISTISGNDWQETNRLIDGITGASEIENAKPIAKRIISKIEPKFK